MDTKLQNRITRNQETYSLFLVKTPSKKILTNYFLYKDYVDEQTSPLAEDDPANLDYDSYWEILRDFVAENIKSEINWFTAIGIVEAVDKIIEEALANANLTKDYEVYFNI